MVDESLDDLTEQDVWSYISEAYEKVIVKTSAYNQYCEDIVSQANAALQRIREKGGKGKKRVLDLGCGTCNVLNILVETHNDIEAVGIDANIPMLRRAKNVLGENSKKVKLIQGDVEKISYQEEFDLVISSNVVFNLKKPFSFFDKTYDALTPGGEFVLSSAMPDPDLELLVKKAREELERDKELTHLIDVAQKANEIMRDKEFHTFSLYEISEILTKFCRFEKVTESQLTYAKQNFLVSVRKPDKPLELVFEVAKGRNRINESFRLKYHVLAERMKLIEPNSDRIFLSPYDPHSWSFQLVDKHNRTVISCLGYTEDSHLGYPMEETTDISEYRKSSKKIENLNTTYTVPTLAGRGYGRLVFALTQRYLRENTSIDILLAEFNPEVKSFFESTGAQIIPGAEYTLDNLPKHDCLWDLRNAEKQKKVDLTIKNYENKHGKIPIFESNF